MGAAELIQPPKRHEPSSVDAAALYLALRESVQPERASWMYSHVPSAYVAVGLYAGFVESMQPGKMHGRQPLVLISAFVHSEL